MAVLSLLEFFRARSRTSRRKCPSAFTGADLDHNRYGMPSQAPAYVPGELKAWLTSDNHFDLGHSNTMSGHGGRGASAGSKSGQCKRLKSERSGSQVYSRSKPC